MLLRPCVPTIVVLWQLQTSFLVAAPPCDTDWCVLREWETAARLQHSPAGEQPHFMALGHLLLLPYTLSVNHTRRKIHTGFMQ